MYDWRRIGAVTDSSARWCGHSDVDEDTRISLSDNRSAHKDITQRRLLDDTKARYLVENKAIERVYVEVWYNAVITIKY
jgi:capsid protein